MKIYTYSETFPDYAERMQCISNQANYWKDNPVALYFALNEPLHARVITKMNADVWLGEFNVKPN